VSHAKPYTDQYAEQEALNKWARHAAPHPFFAGRRAKLEEGIRPHSTLRLLRSGTLMQVAVWIKGTRYNYTIEIDS